MWIIFLIIIVIIGILLYLSAFSKKENNDTKESDFLKTQQKRTDIPDLIHSKKALPPQVNTFKNHAGKSSETIKQKVVATASTGIKPTSLMNEGATYLAWAKKYNFQVVGESACQSELDAIAGPKSAQSKKLDVEALLILEPNNAHDKNAVAVLINNRKVGYLSKAHAIEYRKAIRDLPGAEAGKTLVRVRIIGGWKDSYGEGNYGVLLDIPDDFYRFKYSWSNESLDAADIGLKKNPLSPEQQIFFTVTGIEPPNNVGFFNFTRYRNKKLKELSVDSPEIWQKWQDYIANPINLYNENDVIEFWLDKEEREVFDLKKPKKSEIKKAIQILLDKGIEYEKMLDEPELVYEELININPDLEV